jgi:hypothetical protein
MSDLIDVSIKRWNYALIDKCFSDYVANTILFNYLNIPTRYEPSLDRFTSQFLKTTEFLVILKS